MQIVITNNDYAVIANCRGVIATAFIKMRIGSDWLTFDQTVAESRFRNVCIAVKHDRHCVSRCDNGLLQSALLEAVNYPSFQSSSFLKSATAKVYAVAKWSWFSLYAKYCSQFNPYVQCASRM